MTYHVSSGTSKHNSVSVSDDAAADCAAHRGRDVAVRLCVLAGRPQLADAERSRAARDDAGHRTRCEVIGKTRQL